MGRTLLALVTGAALAWFLDPQKGQERRTRAREQLLSAYEQGTSQVQRMRQGTGATSDLPPGQTRPSVLPSADRGTTGARI